MFAVRIAGASQKRAEAAALQDQRFAAIGANFAAIFILEFLFLADGIGEFTVWILATGFKFAKSAEFNHQLAAAFWTY